jgi:hypothetical protein
MPGDENRLVQRWAWFALNTPMGTGGQGGAWNGNLFDPATRQITEHGRNFARFTCNTVKPTPTPGTTPLGPVITREAEGGNTHGAMTRGEVQSASDCRYIHVPAGVSITADTDAVYNVYVPTTGNYVVWGRGWGIDYNNRSFQIAVGAYPWEPWYFTVGGWNWQKASTTYQLSGNRWYTIKLGPRGNGQARMDMLIVTSDMSFNPNNVGGLIRVCNPTPTPTPTRTNTPTITPTPTVTRTPMPTGPAGIAGQIAFQGRGTAPSAAWQSPLVVSAHLPGDPIPAYQFDVLSSSAGYFQVPTGILTGTYDVGVRDANSLRNIKAGVGLSVSSPHLNLGTLIEGDANLDRAVNILDFALLAGTFGVSQGQAGWDARPDFNGDGTVNILDFSLLATNYGRMGDLTVAASQAPDVNESIFVEPQDAELNATVTVRVQPSSKTVAIGQQFTVDVVLDAGSAPVNTADLRLNFNPTYLTATRLDPLGPFTLQMVLRINADSIEYVNGIPGESGVTGTIPLFRVTFTANQSVASTPLTFGKAEVAGPDGAAHTVVPAGGTVIILAASPTPTRTNTPVTTPVPSPTATNTPAAGTTEIVLRQGVGGYNGFVDTYIDEWNPLVNYHTATDLKLRQPDVRRILIKSDVTMLPPGTIIDKATLTLYQTSGGYNTMTARLHNVLRPWVAPFTTWNAYAQNVPWAQAGCSAVGTDRATALAFERDVFPTWGSYSDYPFDFDVTGLVQGWVNDPANNQGLIMVNGAGPATETIFGSSDNGNESLRPKLVIWYKAGSAITPTPTATTTPDAGGVVQGTVYVDWNANGAADAGEGVAGATVRLRSQSDPTLDRTTLSGADGHYRFEGLAAATYRVQLIAAPAGYAIVDDAAYLVPAGPGVPPYDADFQVRAMPGGGRISLPLILRRS